MSEHRTQGVPQAANAEVVSTQKEAARRLEITPRALRMWKDEDGFPDTSRGYDLGAIRAWRDERDRKGSDASEELKRLRLKAQHEKLRQDTAKANRLEREEQLAQGNLLPRDVWESFAAEVISVARDRLMQLPLELCKHVPKKHHRTLRVEGEKTVRRILTKFAEDLERGTDE